MGRYERKTEGPSWSREALNEAVEAVRSGRMSGKICDYAGHCLALAKTIKNISPEATVICNKGRQGSFEVVVNDKLIYSKLQTMALPDYEEVAEVIQDVSNGGEPREIKGQQPVKCAIS